MFCAVSTSLNCSNRPPGNAGSGSAISRRLRKVTKPPRRYASSQTYSPAPLASRVETNSGEKPSCTDGSTARQRSEIQMTARLVGSGATRRSRIFCMLGTRSVAASRRMGSTPSVEKASAFSCTALRSFSKNTITIEMPSSIWGTGPRRSPRKICRTGALNWPNNISTAQNASENESTQNASEALRREVT